MQDIILTTLTSRWPNYVIRACGEESTEVQISQNNYVIM